MIKYHSQNRLKKIANLHYDYMRSLIEDRLFVLKKVLCVHTNYSKTAQSTINELEQKVKKNSKSSEYSCMKLLTGKTRGENELLSDYFTKVNSTFTNSKSTDLFTFINQNVKVIITSKPPKLLSLSKSENQKLFGQDIWDKDEKEIKELLKWIFPYEDFRSPGNNHTWSAAKMANHLNAPVCLYCNRAYVTNYISSKDNKFEREMFTGQFDHFYEKSEHPILRLSFYNLIPSCTLCNTTLKTGTKTTVKPLVHPYLTGFDDENPPVKFSVPKTLNSDRKQDFEISLEVTPNTSNEVIESRKVFQLKEVYQSHKENVFDILEKTETLNIHSLNDLERTLAPSGVKVKLSPQQFFKLYFGTSPDKSSYQQRPLSKFNRDIAESLGFEFN